MKPHSRSLLLCISIYLVHGTYNIVSFVFRAMWLGSLCSVVVFAVRLLTWPPAASREFIRTITEAPSSFQTINKRFRFYDYPFTFFSFLFFFFYQLQTTPTNANHAYQKTCKLIITPATSLTKPAKALATQQPQPSNNVIHGAHHPTKQNSYQTTKPTTSYKYKNVSMGKNSPHTPLDY